MTNLCIDPTSESDIPLILSLIREFAAHMNVSHEVLANEESLHASLFGPKAYAEVILARLDGRAAGFAIFFHNFSTFLGKPGLYLEDLFVRPEFRNAGIGKALLLYLARLAVERDCGRFEWAVLDANESGIRFYKRLGAVPLEELTLFRLTGDALEKLANEQG